MPEPKLIILNARVSTRQLYLAVQKLPTRKYPARLRAIDQELMRRKAEGSKAA
jgi:hypothetical protein